mmetsp:Transcript_6019/g.9563  ORF Transcript_6019/g.9563 Transcript_6019/m.9563 type:complete len:385 (-) Transcript_6019:598-1752(-)|eukprot:CAMPEP_0202708354 /NCGR_PEP_ID=MMETSP1385-20130828/20585_1 /ASSEMBLY_ACC=CAM_ASM_000861 /TAXON_ID=933848 /ORGANISM="Elphidium margaritaceum" /LENGTH=384 /DNA_ID=CAMNT_0049367311 /DNA_START=30 /DNA_END=1184 /DNA_ORIENTATION=+
MAKRSYPMGDMTMDIAPPTKRLKVTTISESDNKIGKFDEKADVTRTSNLKSPTMLLEGHHAALYTCRFSPDGVHVASAGADRRILLWHVYGECENHTELIGHKNNVLQLAWSGGSDLLFSASADSTAAVWNVEYGTRLKQVKEHSSFVNAISATQRGTQFFATASDDGSCKLFDLRMRAPLRRYDATYQATAVAVSNNALKVYTGGIDNEVKVWDGRQTAKPLLRLTFHSDTLTSLSLSSDQRYLLSSAMDGRAAIWDVGSFVSTTQLQQMAALQQSAQFESMSVDEKEQRINGIHSEHRLVRVIEGIQHNLSRLLIKANWGDQDRKVVSGSSDKMVYIFDAKTGKMEYKLPGHSGSVNEVDFHPKESIIVSCSSDKKLFLGEL